MAGSAVQNAQVSGVASATSIVATLGAAVTAGNAVVAFVEFTGGTESGVTLTNGTDALTLQGAVINDAGTRMARYAKVNCTGGGSTSFTWSNATSLTNRAIWVIECAGIDTSAAVVGGGNPAASAPGAGTDAITTGSITNSAGLTAFHIGIGCDYAADTITIVKSASATQVGSAGWTDVFGTVSAGAIIEYKSGIAASASDALTFTGGYGGHTYKAASIMLKETAGGVVSRTGLLLMGVG